VLRSSGGRVRISVRDTGPGISPENLDKLSPPSNGLGCKVGRGGSGLGLALSKQLVGAMGGKLEVESVVGQGCTFWIELEEAEAPAASNVQFNASKSTTKSCEAGGGPIRSFAWKTTCPISGFLEVILSRTLVFG